MWLVALHISMEFIFSNHLQTCSKIHFLWLEKWHIPPEHISALYDHRLYFNGFLWDRSKQSSAQFWEWTTICGIDSCKSSGLCFSQLSTSDDYFLFFLFFLNSFSSEQQFPSLITDSEQDLDFDWTFLNTMLCNHCVAALAICVWPLYCWKVNI